ncbi:MAG: hypothetical protein UV17_C0063G0002 [Candidatus Gottesmanbacteria bacterium GW2011_GWA1_42_26]|nr:MAG: hypothetical protein UV17_C0063G0002 [Candidatus Gottesmanbacteria bacterium GW2011_GWA1_42_26]
MRSNTVYLIRHAQPDNPKGIFYGRQFDLPLSELGKEQALALALQFNQMNIHPDIILTSPAHRTQQTAAILGNVLGEVEIVVDHDLDEVWSKGLEGKPIDFLAKLSWDPYNYQGPLGYSYDIESPIDIVERMVRAVEHVRKMGKSPFIVGHGDPLAFYFWHVLTGGRDLPSIQKLETDRLYLRKAWAWRIRFVGSRGVEYESISQEKRLRGRESE